MTARTILRMRFGRAWIAALWLALVGPVLADAPSTMPPEGIEIAIAPFLPPQVLVAHYQPMRTHLETALGRPVTFVTAPDYRTYNERLLRGEFKLTLAIAHSAQLAIAERRYVPLLRPALYTRPVLVVRASDALSRIGELRGKVVGTTDPLGIVAMQGLRLLERSGLRAGRDVQIQHFPQHAAAVNYVISGEIAAAIVSDRALTQLPEAARNAVRPLVVWAEGAAPGVVYLANATLPVAEIAQLKHAIQEFANRTDAGKQLMHTLGYDSLIECNASDLTFLAPYAQELKALLATSP